MLSENIHKLLPRLYKFAGAFCYQECDKQDLVQDTILKAFSAQNPPSNFEEIMLWLYKIMRNHFIDKIRHIQNYKRINLDDAYHICDEIFPDTDNGLIMEDIHKAIDHLPPGQKRVVQLRIEGYDYHEIVEKTNMSYGAARVALVNAKPRLAKLLAR